MKRYIRAISIFGMSKAKSDLASWIEEHTRPVMYAIAQLYVFPQSIYENHWREEVWSKFNEMHLFRHNNKLPSPEFIYENSWKPNKKFVKRSIEWAINKEKELTPRKDIDTDELTYLMQLYFVWLSDMLSTNPDVFPEEVYKELDELGL